MNIIPKLNLPIPPEPLHIKNYYRKIMKAETEFNKEKREFERKQRMR